MKSFLLGVVSTVLVLAVAAALVIVSIGSGVDPAPAPPPPTPSAGSATPPADLGAGQTWLGRVVLRSPDVLSDQAHLLDVRATGQGVRFGGAGLQARRLTVEATVPFDTVAARAGAGTRIFPAGGGRVGVERTTTVLGRDVRVRATGTVRADRGQVLVEPETIEIGGPAFLDALLGSAARSLVTIRQDVDGVPKGLVLRHVAVTGTGLRVRLDGADVTLGR